VLSQPAYFIALPVIKVIAAQLVALKVYDLGATKLSPNELVGGATFLVAAACFAFNVPRLLSRSHLRPMALCILLLGLWCVLASMASANPLVKLIEATKILGWMLLIPVVGFYIDTPAKLRKLRTTGIMCFMIVVVHLIAANILHIGENVSKFYQLTMPGPYIGYFTQPAEISLTLGSSLMFLLLRAQAQNQTVPPTPWSAALLSSAGLAMMVPFMVRAPLIVFTLAILSALLFDRGQRIQNKRSIVMILALISAMAVGGAYVAANYQKFINERFKDVTLAVKSGNAKSIGSGRVGLLEVYLESIEQRSFGNLLTGIDLTGSSDVFHPVVGSHNDWIDVTFKFGLISIMIYMIFWAVTVRTVYHRYKSAVEPSSKNLLSVAAALCIAYIALSFHGMLFYQFPMHSLAIILGTALGRLGAQSDEYNIVTSGVDANA